MLHTLFSRLLIYRFLAFSAYVWLGLAAGFSVSYGQQLAELEAFVGTALNHHPRIAELQYRVARAGNRYDELYGFFDPSLQVAGGASDDLRAVPGIGGLGSMSSEAYEIQGSLEIPFRPGFYATVGMTERHLRDPDDYDRLNQTLAGVGIRIPLLQDRGFAVWDLDRQILFAEYDRVLSAYLTERQRLRHDVEQAYISACESLALREISLEATGRNQALVRESQSLAEHKAIAQYQVFAAQAELELGKTDDLAAWEHVETSLLSLAELICSDSVPKVTMDRVPWLERTAELKIAPTFTLAQSLQNRGDYLAVLNERLTAEFGAAREMEFLRSDLSLRAQATWHVEDENTPLGSADTDEEDRLGGHIMLVYQRPLGFRAEKSRLAEQRNRLAEIDARLRGIELFVKRDLKTSLTRLEFAGKRLTEATLAVGFASQNLAAEQERFRLGESRSRNVLDAQKDVTKAQRAQVTAATGVLQAWSDYRFSAGYPAGSLVHQNIEEMKLK